MRYRFIQQHQGQFPTATLCRAMRVSRNGFYAWRVRLPSRRAGQDAVLVGHIRAAHRESHQTYGSPRLYHELREQGLRCGRHRIARLMRENGLSARLPKRFVATTDSRHALPVAQNLLGRGFSAERANTKWCGDITYVPTAQGWLYLAVVRVQARLRRTCFPGA